MPAAASALEVLAANGVEVRIAKDDEYTPTPAISHAVLTYNRGRTSGLADGIVVTPSHNPPDDGGFKYDPPNGGPADTTLTRWIEQTANDLLAAGLAGRAAASRSSARAAPTPPASTTTSTPTSATSAPSSTSTRSSAPASASASTRWAAPAPATGRTSPTATGST